MWWGRLPRRRLPQRVVESAHPYQSSASPATYKVCFPGARALTLAWDRRCCIHPAGAPARASAPG